jgi:uncharacterized low-complexity protein
MSMSSKKPVSLAVGAALTATLAAAPLSGASAADNPFAMEKLSSGYMLLAGTEGKCGAEKAKSTEEEMGAEQAKPPAEGKCATAKCGADKTKVKPAPEEKSGAGKCGGNK